MTRGPSSPPIPRCACWPSRSISRNSAPRSRSSRESIVLSKRKGLLALGAAIALLHVLWTLRLPFGAFNDDALHVLLARALLSGSFVLPDPWKTPVTDPLPGFAALLAVPARLIAPRWWLLRLGSLAVSWLSLWLTWRLARRFLPAAWSAAAVFFVAANTVFIMHCGAVLPDIPYMAFSLALFDGLAGKPTRGRLALLGFGAGLAALLRPQGLILILSLGAAIGAAAGASALIYWAMAAVPPAAWSARNYYLTGHLSGYWPSWRHWLDALSLRDQLAHGVRLTAALFGDGVLGISQGPFWVKFLGGLLVLALAAWGALRERKALVAVGMADYFVGLAFLHLFWGLEFVRYLLPALPLVWIFILAAARPVFNNRVREKVALGVVFLATSLWRVAALMPPAQAQERTAVFPETMAWIRQNTAPDARFQSAWDADVMLLAERPAVPLFRLVTYRDQWLALCLGNGIQYVLVDRNRSRWSAEPGGDKEIAALETMLPGPYLKEVYGNPIEGSRVFKLDHPDPARYLRAWADYREAVKSFQEKAERAYVTRKLKQALDEEPNLAYAWAALASLQREPIKQLRCLERAAQADPSSEIIQNDLNLVRAGRRRIPTMAGHSWY